ncbi:peptidase M14 [Winogradskyella sp. PC-19]|uniref:M14 family metallopeptidase n=1 Tax=unclassified Winogradskyella TaxID=2615021 RepID=UPI000B3CCA5A|nr:MULTISPECIES: M14 metallopeptidase family protein [unclassified Winogradskyella]ARV08606.1 peptidase M14 [Winogradskyella sp. PC-19]RZN75391.1 MAG: peptidase M14 [Winogradskyella sp.]
MTSEYLTELYNSYKEKSLYGRYITNENITKILDELALNFHVSTIGYSVENRPIFSLKVGSGKTKILLWSQMHGNESTTTKALFDFLNAANKGELSDILEYCTLQIIPILNPDGAEKYTRINANKIDLNRDAQDLSQSESVVLRKCFDDFKPNYCFNLHGQRTIFGVGNTGNSATLSFLSPAEDKERSVTTTRKKAMSVIAVINDYIQKDLPNAVGRYDDGFNINCVGDTFQSLGVPTILYEAGHYKNDYEREQTRLFVFKSLIYGLCAIAKGVEVENFESYFDIPQNEKNFYDVIIRNSRIRNSDKNTVDIGIQFKEVLELNMIKFIPFVEKIENLDGYFAHNEIDANGNVVLDQSKKEIQVANEIVFVMLNNCKTLIKS